MSGFSERWNKLARKDRLIILSLVLLFTIGLNIHFLEQSIAVSGGYKIINFSGVDNSTVINNNATVEISGLNISSVGGLNISSVGG